MLLADKITEERKKLSLSQEELAEKLSVSRQAVSKWESAQSIPDLQRLILMSELFSVSTDYLLKDEAQAEKHPTSEADSDRAIRRVTMEEANAYLSAMEVRSREVSLGIGLCILCPVLLIFFVALAEGGLCGVTETIACAVGLTALFALVAFAVFLFVRSGSKTERFTYLEKEAFETAYGVTELVKEKKADFEPIYVRFLSLGIVLFVLSPLPLILAALLHETETLLISLSALLLCIIAVGVYAIVRVATVRESYEVLLQEGEYRQSAKKKNELASAVSTIYWCLTVAVYLLWSLMTKDWKSTWIVWVVAGLLCAPVMTISRMIGRDGN